MSTISHTPPQGLPAAHILPKSPPSADEGAEKCPDRLDSWNPDQEDADDLHNGITVSANMIDHLKNNPLFEKMSGLVAGVLVLSGIKKIYSGIKKGDRPQFLEGSKQTMWGTYCGLTAIDTVFKTAMSLTPFMRAVGGFFTADLGITALCQELKGKEKADVDRAIFHGSAAAWGIRHVAMGIDGLGKTRWAAGLIEKAAPAFKAVLTTPVFGAVGMALGAAGGALDTLLGARLLTKGIKTGDREKKILGSLDIGTGIAMGASCLLTGLPGVAAIGLGTLGIVYRTWRTDKEEIKGYIRIVKDTALQWGHKIKDTIEGIFGHNRPPVAGITAEQASGSAADHTADNGAGHPSGSSCIDA